MWYRFKVIQMVILCVCTILWFLQVSIDDVYKLSTLVFNPSSYSAPVGAALNYIFILDLTPGFNGLGKDNCKTGRETFMFWDLVHFISEVWRYFKGTSSMYRIHIHITLNDMHNKTLRTNKLGGYANKRVWSIDHSGYGCSQWRMTLQCNVVSHWLSPYSEWSLWSTDTKIKIELQQKM